MPKKFKKKKKLKIIPFLILVIVVAMISFAVKIYLDIPIRNIVIKNNKYISDYEVITTLKLENYPAFALLNSKSMSNKLKENDLVENVTISKKFFNVLEIDIQEEDILFKKQADNKYVFANKKEVSLNENIIVPNLMNYVPDSKYERLISSMKEVKKEVLNKISEIEYVPSELDEERFLLLMSDKNLIYLTITKFDRINYYEEVLPQLNGKKGILYFDSGNHFEILE